MQEIYVATSSLRRALCVFLEWIIIILALVAAVMLRRSYHADEIFNYPLLVQKALLLAFVLVLCFYYSDLYEDRIMRRRVDFFVQLGQSLVAAALLLSLTYYAVPALTVGRRILTIFIPLSIMGILIWRGFYFLVFGRKAVSDKVLIIGTGETAKRIAMAMLQRAPFGYRMTGFLGEHRAEVGRRLVNPSIIGTVNELIPLVEKLGVSRIVVALEDRRGKLPIADLLRCRMRGVAVEEAPSFFERLTGKILVRNLRPSWLVFSRGFSQPRLLRNTKRLIEFFVALAVIFLSAPLLAFLAIIIKLASSGPVLYRQERVGEHGRLFELLKFRTMRADAEAESGPVWASAEGDPRITRVGRWLRLSRLDELPQVFNVLRGDMSFVGPRPERPHFVEKLRGIIPYYDERHSAKPGITGWAQVKFRYGATIEDTEEKLQFDLYYIKHMSLLFDLAIVLDTFKVVLFGKGAR